MQFFLKIIFLSLFFLFSGCSKNYYEVPKASLIVIKSPKLKYADMGFIYRGKRQVKAQVYSSGKAVFTLTIGKRICIDSKCMSEEQFYRSYLNVKYPKGTLANIFLKKPIFNNEDLHKERGKWKQQIFDEDKFDIIYTFDSTSARFKDKTNHILIKIVEK
ncbi:hypothetical protein [Hydrogenimonas thermophila]|uniref:Lipoprotein n=1 Tax=Hydrogenimonas thermophila TaxID=223786 RepID=A0A1I5T813_9BACT|nr:hypothetical protein [Hydrogenimonas thermophila]WOE70234.1 hypothetical protein RZR91_01380 [Hydrogenimonas thermophila]WOE72751.1 hypothetical protein RZR97_01370 [Hydrogenimonas thermophila]SFP79194.1 hypothetical protein SAMN05216234_1417 [Hydrogenimonas thermophila]